jgi:hypothetical protein
MIPSQNLVAAPGDLFPTSGLVAAAVGPNVIATATPAVAGQRTVASRVQADITGTAAQPGLALTLSDGAAPALLTTKAQWMLATSAANAIDRIDRSGLDIQSSPANGTGTGGIGAMTLALAAQLVTTTSALNLQTYLNPKTSAN